MDPIYTAIIAVILIVIAWKLLKGIVKTVALVALAAAAAYFIFGVQF